MAEIDKEQNRSYIFNLDALTDGSEEVDFDFLVTRLANHELDEIVCTNGVTIRLTNTPVSSYDYRVRRRANNNTQTRLPSKNSPTECFCLATCCGLSAVGWTSRAIACRFNTVRRCWTAASYRCWLVQDFCGMTALAITWFLMLFATLVLNIYVFVPAIVTAESAKNSILPAFNFFMFHAIALLALTSHLKTAFTNPGAIRVGNCTPQSIQTCQPGTVLTLCKICRSLKTDRSHHCSVCNRCIRKMDHHCPWVNNCVGQANQKFFILFAVYICMMSFYSLLMIGLKLYQCSQNNWTGCNWTSSTNDKPSPTAPIPFILIICVGFESILFGLFTLIMTCSQLASVYNDETGIEALQKERREKNKNCWMANLSSVFSSPPSTGFNIRWLSPFHPVLTETSQQQQQQQLYCQV